MTSHVHESPADPVAQDVRLVREALNRGSYSPEAAGWQAFFDATTRDIALTALDRLEARVKVLEEALAENTDFEWKTQEC